MFKCTKNLALNASHIIIMKNDIIRITGSDFVEDLNHPDGGMVEYDIEITVSDMCEGANTSINIFQLAEHFEYVSYRTKQTCCRNV